MHSISIRSIVLAVLALAYQPLAMDLLADERIDSTKPFPIHDWIRDSRNPIFVPKSPFDAKGAQGPSVVLHDGKWWMFYAGIGSDGVQRICLATASPSEPTEWTSIGPLLDPGTKDSFDEISATYPRVHRVGEKWHLYYSGRSRRNNEYHFSNYWGIGLAQSDDLRTWTRYSSEPVLEADGIKEYPECRALVGLGNLCNLPQAGSHDRYRMYYTLLPGLKDPDWQKNGNWHVVEHKVCVAAESDDGIHWTDRKVVFDRRRDNATEDIGVVGLNVWASGTGFQGLYTGLGTRFKTYSLCEALSADGLSWDRGTAGDNVSLTAQQEGWDSGMIGYPCVLVESDGVRVFYNGSSGGGTGVGMAFVRTKK